MVHDLLIMVPSINKFNKALCNWVLLNSVREGDGQNGRRKLIHCICSPHYLEEITREVFTKYTMIRFYQIFILHKIFNKYHKHCIRQYKNILGGSIQRKSYIHATWRFQYQYFPQSIFINSNVIHDEILMSHVRNGILFVVFQEVMQFQDSVRRAKFN